MNKVLQFKEALQTIPDARSKHDISHPFHGILALALLGLIARQIYMTHIVEWATIYWDELKEGTVDRTAKIPYTSWMLWHSLRALRLKRKNTKTSIFP